ncbi:MAG: AMP-binding protein [Waddliaceae bacterium]
MPIDWSARTTEIFLNPRIPSENRQASSAHLQDYPLDRHIWVATSGTTSRFKFVALGKEAFLSSAEAMNAYLGSDASDVWLHALPDFHVGGIAIWARSYLSGAQVVKAPLRWNPEAYVDSVHQNRATLSSLVPTQVYDLVSHRLPPPPTLRAVIVGGGALAEPVFHQAQELGWHLFPSYGLTECASTVAVANNSGVAEILPHVQVNINAQGYICLKGSSLLTLYGIQRGKTIHFIDPKENGWLTTEDKGELVDQQLRIGGRADDFVKILGESVNLISLQNTLDECKCQLEIARDAALIAVPYPREGSRMHLVIEGRSCSEISALIEAYNLRVMPYESIQRVHSVEKIPRSPLGKLQKADLFVRNLNGLL